jgi:phage baseplate assembly protein gpV
MKKQLGVSVLLAVLLALATPLSANAAISWTAPGCTSTGVCMKRGDGTPIGYDGTGSLAINQGSIRSVAAGNRTTTVTLSTGTTYVIQATTMITFPNGLQTVKSISR